MLKISLLKNVEYVKNLQTSRINNSKIPKIRNVKFAGYCLHSKVYMNKNIYRHFQTCINVPLM